jgi:hypothetical protein
LTIDRLFFLFTHHGLNAVWVRTSLSRSIHLFTSLMLNYRPGGNKAECCGDNGYRDLTPPPMCGSIPHSNISDKTWHGPLWSRLNFLCLNSGTQRLIALSFRWGSLEPLGSSRISTDRSSGELWAVPNSDNKWIGPSLREKRSNSASEWFFRAASEALTYPFRQGVPCGNRLR